VQTSAKLKVGSVSITIAATNQKCIVTG